MTNNVQSEINALKILLSQTDYVALKVAEAEMYGENTDEFVEMIEKRRAWRAKINELEALTAETSETEAVEDTSETTSTINRIIKSKSDA